MTSFSTKTLPSGLTLAAMSTSDADAIEALHAMVFGPGRFARTAFRVRERATELFSLSRKALLEDELVGAVTMSRVLVGETSGVLLGPLAVSPRLRDLGIGRLLLAEAVQATFEAGEPYVLLVGDLPYYAPTGFQRVPVGSIAMPGPVDPSRLLIALRPGHEAVPVGKVVGS